MSIQAHSYLTLNPSFMEPELYVQYSQQSGFVDLLADEQLRVRLAPDDLLVYAKQLNIRTKVGAGQTLSGQNELPGIDITATMFSTATYKVMTRAQYDHNDVAAAGRWGFAVPEAYRLGQRQAHFQFARDAALHGIQPNFGEGILHAEDALVTNLPADSNGNTNVQLYDNGEMAFYMAGVIRAIKTRTLQLGIGKKFTILGPQRVLSLFEYNVVQVTQFQREGAGTASTRGTLDAILQANGDTVSWSYDDTLEGAGPGGSDAVIFDMPELDKPVGAANAVDTNAFAGILPSNKVCVTQYCDKAAPTEIISPLPGGGTDVVTEWRHSSGWAPRGTAITIVGMPYDN